MAEANPVFIVGEAAVGRPSLPDPAEALAFAPQRQSLVETEMFAHLPRAFLFSRTYPQPGSASFSRTVENGNASSFHSGARAATAALAPLNYLRRDRWDWLYHAGMGPAVLRSFVLHATQARGCRRLVEKTPTNADHLTS